MDAITDEKISRELHLTGFPTVRKKELMTVAGNYGISMNDYVKKVVIDKLLSEPEHLKQERA